MRKFIHKQTRLNCSIYQAYREFLVKDKLEKWLCDTIELENMNYEFKIDYNGLKIDTEGSKITKKDKNKKLIINLIDKNLGVDSILEINFMRCASRTVNCTEIHLMHKNLKNDNIEKFGLFWEKALDTLRYFYNKDWVIADNELTLTKLTGRGL